MKAFFFNIFFILKAIDTKTFQFSIMIEKGNNLFGLLSLLVLIDVEVSQLVGVLAVGNDTEPIAELVLLQELLGQVLQVS